MSNKLQQAINLIKSGDKQGGGQLLTELVKEEPENENGWLWLASIVGQADKRAYCLKQVLRLNPNHETAQRILAELQQKQQAQSISAPQQRPKQKSHPNEPAKQPTPAPESDAEEKELIEYVVKQLGQHMTDNDIITEICYRRGIDWKQAEQFVQQVKAEHKRRIARRQSPLIIIIAIGTILAGIFLILNTGSYLLEFIQDPAGYLLDAEDVYTQFAAFGTGLAMVCGGLVGLWWMAKAL